MTVYLLHFDEPLGDLNNPRGQARHYIGTAHDVEIRLRQHRKGNGAKITQAFWERHIDFRLARTWEGGYEVERRLKQQKNAPRLCPICQSGDTVGGDRHHRDGCFVTTPEE